MFGSAHSPRLNLAVTTALYHAACAVICALVAGIYLASGQYVTHHLTAVRSLTVASLTTTLLAHSVVASSRGQCSRGGWCRRWPRTAAGALCFYAVVHVTLVLFGAPLVASAAETAHLAVLITVLGGVPWLVLGTSVAPGGARAGLSMVDAVLWATRAVPSGSPFDEGLWWCAMSVVVGCWVGAWPIPLDWDRPWQRWPVTCSSGACAAYVAAASVSALRAYWLGRAEARTTKPKRV